MKGVRKGQQAEKVQRAATSGKSTESNAILPRCSPGWPKRSLRTEKTPTLGWQPPDLYIQLPSFFLEYESINVSVTDISGGTALDMIALCGNHLTQI